MNEPKPSGIGTPPKRRALIVDDDPIFTVTAAACLSRAGYDVRTAADGVEALELLGVEAFDVALVDLTMPRIDGLRLIALIRGDERLQRLAIMVVSARHDAGAYKEALALGADAVQTKPLDWAALPGRIATMIAEAVTA